MRSDVLRLLVAVPVCLIIVGASCSGEDAYRLARLGGQLTPDEKASLEEQVAKSPNDVESRTKLLGYYFIKGRHEADAKSARERHVMWLIENAPEAEVLGLSYSQFDAIIEPEGYDQAKQAWLKAIEESPENTAILKNASRFFLLHDRKISEDLLLKGQKLDSKDPQWPASLGHLYSLGLTSRPEGATREAAAEKAFRHYELAYKLSDVIEKDALLSKMAKTALAAGLKEDARKIAEKMLENHSAGWNHGNRVHHGNIILGRIALSEGDVDEAKSRLLLAGKTEGSPQLNSFGPNMQLAKELLERSETEVVLEYFDLCKKFWALQRGKLALWTSEVKSGRIPDFGANLAR